MDTCCSAEARQKWIEEIDKIERIGTETIIPGRQKPGMQFDKSSLDFTREYLRATDNELAKTSTIAEFYYAMNQHFPQANLSSLSLLNAMNHKLSWNWRDAQ